MSDWKVITLGDCASFQEGYVNPSKNEPSYFGGTVKWLRATDLNNGFVYKTSQTLTEKGFLSAKKSAVLFEPDSLAISKSGTIGRIGILKDYMCGNRAVINIKVNENICNPLFIFYTLLNSKEQIETLAEGSVQKNLYVSALSKVKLLLPDINKQKEIGYILNALDQKIEINTQINQTLEQISQALFKSWFVDFDPVRAKVQALSDGLSLEQAELAAMQAISGKTPEELTALSQTQPDRYAELAETAKAFPCEMVEVDGVEVPKGWEVKPFGSLLENTIGGDWGKEEEDEKHTENVFVFRGTDLPNVQKNEFDAIPKRYIAKNKLKSRKAKYGDIIIEVSGGSKNQPTGRSLLITKNLLCNFDLPIIPASFCRLFTPINKQIAVLLACHLKMIYTQGKTWEYQVQSTGISNFQTTNFLENELLVIPDENILNAFYEKVGVIFEKMTLNENMLLSKTRDLLLPRLLNGEMIDA